MSNEISRSVSIWAGATIVVGVIAVAAAGWDAMLHNKNRALERRVKDLETQVTAIETKAKAAEASSYAARRRARAAAGNGEDSNAADQKPEQKGASKPAPQGGGK